MSCEDGCGLVCSRHHVMVGPQQTGAAAAESHSQCAPTRVDFGSVLRPVEGVSERSSCFRHLILESLLS